MNILILAAGPGAVRDGGGYPLCLMEFRQRPLIEAQLARCAALAPDRVFLAFNEPDIQTYHLDRIVQLLCPQATVVPVRGATGGAACTALLAAGGIDSPEELLILNGNEFLDVDHDAIVASLRARGLDAGTAVFRSVHPRYSYVRLDENKLVVEASEKKPISTQATAGFYWFARGSDFVAAAKNQIRKDASAQGGFYICPTFNELILAHKRIGVVEVPVDSYHPLKTQRQVEQFEVIAERQLAI